MMRTIVIGDVHGCIDELKLLLKEVDFKKGNDRCIIVGDLVDRGPDSAGVVSFCVENSIESVMGNHDEKHIRNARNLERHPDSRVKLTDSEKDMWKKLSQNQQQWLSSLPNLIWINETTVCVHAGLMTDIEPKDTHQRILHRIRYVEQRKSKSGSLNWEMSRMKITDDGGFLRPRGSVPWTDVYGGKYNVVYGHWAREDVKIDKYENSFALGIDTSSCFGGKLTAAIFDNSTTEYKLVSVNSSVNTDNDRFYEGEYDP